MENSHFVIVYVCLLITGLMYYAIYIGTSTVIAALAIVALLYLIQSTLLTEDKAPKLYYADTPLSKHVIQNCKRLREPFRPPYWARNNHVQTVLPLLLPTKDSEFRREILCLNDGGHLALDYGISRTESLPSNATILLVIPGLNGDARSVSPLCVAAIGRGHLPVVFNKRGLTDLPLVTPKMLSSGDPSDVREAVMFLKRTHPDSDMAAVAYSAGCLLLRMYLGEYGASSYISAAACNSPGYQHQRLFQKLMQPYDFFLLRGLKQMLQKHRTILSELVDVDTALRANRVIKFEELVLGKMHNYKDITEYCDINDSIKTIEKSVTPFLCINSADDPICIKELFPYDFFRKQSNAMLAVTSQGGHCTFLERSTWSHWSDEVALDFIEAVMDFNRTHASK